MLHSLHPLVIFPILSAAMSVYLGRAYSAPTPALYSTIWPFLIGYILPGETKNLLMSRPCIVINARTGNMHANSSQTLELLFQAHSNPNRRHHPRALRVTLLYIPQRPEIPSWTADVVSRSALWAIVLQVNIAAAAVCVGLASPAILAIIVADALAGLSVWEFHRYALHRKFMSTRTVPRGQREVLCIASGTNATDAIVVVSEAGAAKLEDLAEGRARPSPHWVRARFVAVPLFVLVAYAVSVGFFRLSDSDAWCLSAVWLPGFAHAAYSSRARRSAAALGFRFAEKDTRIVQADKDMQTLVEVETIEHGAGLAFIPVFFPDKRRSEEDV